jgi:hypothetical protein
MNLAERNSWQRKRMQQIALRGNFSGSRLAVSARNEISAFIAAHGINATGTAAAIGRFTCGYAGQSRPATPIPMCPASPAR